MKKYKFDDSFKENAPEEYAIIEEYIAKLDTSMESLIIELHCLRSPIVMIPKVRIAYFELLYRYYDEIKELYEKNHTGDFDEVLNEYSETRECVFANFVEDEARRLIQARYNLDECVEK